MADMFLALADIHGETEMLERILKENPHTKGIFVAGDLTNFGKEKEAERIISVFSRVATNAALFFVAGNCDTSGARHFFEKQPGYLEQKCFTLAMGRGEQKTPDEIIRIIGCGGGLRHTGLTPFEISDKELESGLRRAYEHCVTEEHKNAIPLKATTHPLIVLTHTPPRDSFADMRHMKHLGSAAFASMLYEYEPLLWICGHIHESRGAQWEDRTLVVNPGPAAHGSYAQILVEQKPRGLHAVAELRAL
ncbi:putative Metallophosphoesterase, Calcineurin-like family [uncultured spirochete]|jgi:Icc-related predicted phosphoesterase|uniref:Putative Metallophosphoesterase, Calcineurin-like family n=1 Tax=uncultured spirochete TaxID=156406 RepID=A0A3P3XUA0_9SPIR|nr:putative Metallophosphoesterase, Calcineurin-like family [uncultured spirochete]